MHGKTVNATTTYHSSVLVVKLNLHKAPTAAAMTAAIHAATHAAQPNMTVAPAVAIHVAAMTAATAAVMIAAQDVVAYHNGVSGLKVVSHLTNPHSIVGNVFCYANFVFA